MKIKCDFCDAEIDTDNLKSNEGQEFSLRQPIGRSMSGHFPLGKPIIACEKHKEQQEQEVKRRESRYL